MLLTLANFAFSATTFAITDRIIHDPYTGLAIGGFDPVAYFIDNRPVPGLRDHEIAWDGAYWRFANEGNADAFAKAPDVYVPAYGGYGVSGVAKGVPQAGDPTIFTVYRGRLFFFYAKKDMETFYEDPDAMIAAADKAWPMIKKDLAD